MTRRTSLNLDFARVDEAKEVPGDEGDDGDNPQGTQGGCPQRAPTASLSPPLRFLERGPGRSTNISLRECGGSLSPPQTYRVALGTRGHECLDEQAQRPGCRPGL